ncbi:MAG: hypothetical protein ABIF82_08650 [Planctomycetota bacterium]
MIDEAEREAFLVTYLSADLRRRLLWVAVVTALVVTPVVLFCVFLTPIPAIWRFNQGIRAVTRSNDFDDLLQDHAGDGKSQWELNTVVNEVESSTVERSYHKACQRAIGHWQAVIPPTTYLRCYEEGWPVLSTVFQGDKGFLEIMVYEGNDSDGTRIRVAHGVFEELFQEGRLFMGSRVETRADHRVPDYMLRCNWR